LPVSARCLRFPDEACRLAGSLTQNLPKTKVSMPQTPQLPDPSNAALPCVLDIEASGFGRNSYPIEVGYALPDGRTVCMLVRPTANWTHWDANAQQVHGISRETLNTHGRPVAEVARALNQDLAGLTVYCDGWAHDYPWLAALFDAADQRPRFKLDSVGRLLTDERLHRLDEARRLALAEMGLTRHRASNDARALQRALSRV
jgi:DNA polymerase III epsilon subunit-like protein